MASSRLRIELPRVFGIGTSVLIEGTIRATVLAVAIYPRGVQYQCAWWLAGARHCEWLEELEITPADGDAQPLPIGFVRDGR